MTNRFRYWSVDKHLLFVVGFQTGCRFAKPENINIHENESSGGKCDVSSKIVQIDDILWQPRFARLVRFSVTSMYRHARDRKTHETPYIAEFASS